MDGLSDRMGRAGGVLKRESSEQEERSDGEDLRPYYDWGKPSQRLMRAYEEKICRESQSGHFRGVKFAKPVTVLYFCITHPEPNL